MGLIFLGVGAAGMFAASGARLLAALALAAALLHVVNHAGFKTLLFVAAGSVVRATGTRDLDALGGLRARMPATTGAVRGRGAGRRGAAAGQRVRLRVAAAAVALHAQRPPGTVACRRGAGRGGGGRADRRAGGGHVRQGARRRVPRPPAQRRRGRRAASRRRACVAGMGLAAAGLRRAGAGAGAGRCRRCPGCAGAGAQAPDRRSWRRLNAGAGRYAGASSPLLMRRRAVVVGAVLAVTCRGPAGPSARRRRALWDCGAGPLTARMEYTATSFAEPLQRVFDDVLRPEQRRRRHPPRRIRGTWWSRSRYRQRVPDRIEHRLYRPVLAASAGSGRPARRWPTAACTATWATASTALVALLIVLVVTG